MQKNSRFSVAQMVEKRKDSAPAQNAPRREPSEESRKKYEELLEELHRRKVPDDSLTKAR